MFLLSSPIAPCFPAFDYPHRELIFSVNVYYSHFPVDCYCFVVVFCNADAAVCISVRIARFPSEWKLQILIILIFTNLWIFN